MKINRVFIGSIAITILIVLIGILLAPKGSSSNPSIDLNEKAKIELNQTVHDWGDINMNDGKVTHIFRIRSVGEDDLRLANFKTSCMCTEVKFKTQNLKTQESPTFGMHPKSDWVGVLEPGEEGEIEAVFDPAFHGPQGTGPIVRTVTFETNDKNSPIVELKLEAYVN